MRAGLSHKDADALALRVPVEFRREEVALIPSRWWDYRLMHPTHATYLFAQYYENAHRTWWHRYIDCEKADAQKLWHLDLFQHRDLVAVWQARQAADRLALPYPFTCEFALNRSLQRQFRHILRPNQMYGEEYEVDLLAAWQDANVRGLVLPDSDFYRVAQYSNHPYQNEFRRSLVKTINERAAPRYRVLARLMLEDRITDAMVAHHWPEELERTRSYAMALSV